MKYFKLSLLFVFLELVIVSCNGFLNYTPKGKLNSKDLNTPTNVNKLSNAAYAALNNSNWFVPYEYMWPYGSVRSDNTYKGGLGQADQGDFNSMELFTSLRPTNIRNNQLWKRLYIAVNRTNLALKKLKKVSKQQFPKKVQREAEMHFLRGHFYFLLKKLYKYIPYVDATMPRDSINKVSNRKFTSNELWDKIANDFKFAVKNLPLKTNDMGRPNKLVAEAYLAKVRLFQAYQQGENNQVTSINKQDLQTVVKLTDEVINSGRYGLFNSFAQDFLYEFDNGKEILFSVQHSKNDGTPSGRLERDAALNYTMNSAYGCCSFNRPSQNLVDAFQTNKQGLPMFGNFNSFELNKKKDFQNHTFDPRLDHTVGVPGHPYKYQNDMIYNVTDFTRAPGIYGPFSDMKPTFKADCSCRAQIGGGAFLGSSRNDDIIRYDDVLLWKAEALIQLGRQNEALPIINKIRARAKHSKKRLKYNNGQYYSNYNIGLYKLGSNINWTQQNAFKALRWERRLEFATEGTRFFALVRWGIAAKVINKYLQVAKKRHSYLSSAHFTKGRDEYLPIPQKQIQLSNGVYKQNPGY